MSHDGRQSTFIVHDNMTVTLNKADGTHQTASMESGMVTLNSPATAHTMSIASLGRDRRCRVAAMEQA
eukprot:CAMPEP_0174694918 /NCGR_PEP_ID=MMETSP1094-20130205/1396_1 /TAXON_ID=156173 /ORGANISM="Chrysochromulina brevifilum, Strain UTEX LB 985" /LENGTH=67 /DNA_ID=CAMNT_0015891281 /DNA_START=49 /DNA_END=249 /DNA_ORIENTATION=+